MKIIIIYLINRRFPEVCTVTLNVFCENPGGFLFLLVCLFMTLFMALFLTAIILEQKVIEGSNFNTTLFKLLRKNGFFIFLKFQFFQGQKVNFRKFQGHFFKIVIEG